MTRRQCHLAAAALLALFVVASSLTFAWGM